MSKRRLLTEWSSCAVFLATFGLAFGHNAFILAVAVLALIEGLLAISVNVVQGLAGQVSLAQAGLMAIAAYTTAYLNGVRHIAMPWALAAAFGGAVIAGFVVAIATVRFSELMHFAIATLGFTLILQGALSNWSAAGASSGLSAAYSLPGLTSSSGTALYWYVSAIIMVILAAQAVLMRSRVGHAFVAIRENPLLSASLGISGTRYRILAMTISAVPAALAGILFGYSQTFINPNDFGLTLTVNVIVMAVVGGAGTLIGPLVGAAAFGATPELFSVSGEARSGVFGLILVVVVVFAPGGLLGLADLVARRVRRALVGKQAPPEAATRAQRGHPTARSLR